VTVHFESFQKNGAQKFTCIDKH